MVVLPDVNTIARPPARLAGLDLLRLVAVLLVIGRHIPGALDPAMSIRHPLLATWARGGWVGVDIFFVLSGYLVSGLLFTEYTGRGQLSPMRFYVRRAWKIYPPFYLLLVATVIVYGTFRQELRWSWLLSEVLFVQSYVPGLWMHTWSLAIEEHFYLLLPLVLLLVVKRDPAAANPFRPVLLLGLGIVVLELILRVVNWRLHPAYAYQTHLSPTHLRMDSLFLGVMLSYVHRFHTRAFIDALTPWRWLLIATGTVLLVPAFVFPLETTPFVYTAGFTLFGVAGAMLVAGTVLCARPHARRVAPLATLGAYSYSIYLWHLPVVLWAIPLAEQTVGVRFALGFRAMLSVVGSLAFGAAMAKIVEAPALRLRDRWFPSRSSGADRAAEASRASIRAGATIEALQG
jgi:peptidoglycan/LPS O-acetylase OafA/YrhL